ncbi:MAG: NADP-dependent malic enzyme [Candidatus Aenigmatarchaeota archaeon]|nr:MAG: NADP-dependent malic enzyme [Candidatus Aenigmarchaeota archaeon]
MPTKDTNGDLKKAALKYHADAPAGKIGIVPTKHLRGKKDLALAYTPGVVYPCLEIKENVERAYDYTSKGNTIAILTDGSRILGLGNIGPEAGLPVMEGKSLLFKMLGDVDAIPICVRSQDTQRIVDTMVDISPGFGGVNVEDIKHPRCFEVEETLERRLDIPIFHDDQHGTAVVTLAGLMNAFKVTGRKLRDARIVVNGAGAAGRGITKLLLHAGARDVIVIDTKGPLYEGRAGMDRFKAELAMHTNPDRRNGGLENVMIDADVFIGASSAGLLDPKLVRVMNDKPIVFALANPVPEIDPLEAKRAGAAVVGTGSSRYANQINNVLAFPGMMRGMLDVRAKRINDEMKLAAAQAIADSVKPTAERVVPDARTVVAHKVAAAVAKAAESTGAARKGIGGLKKYEKSVYDRIAAR